MKTRAILLPLALLSACSKEAPAEQAATEAATNPALAGDEDYANPPPEEPDIAALIAADDPSACAAPISINSALSIASPIYQKGLADGIAPIGASAISAVGVNKDIHEISCSANVSYTTDNGYSPSAQVSYKLRPSLDKSSPAVVEVQKAPDLVSLLYGYVAYEKRPAPAHKLTDEEMSETVQ